MKFEMKNWILESDLTQLKLDIIVQLWTRNLDHVLQIILHDLDSLTLENCKQVSQAWKEILESVLSFRSCPMKKQYLQTEDSITSLEANDEIIALGFYNGMLKILDRLSLVTLHCIKGHSDPITAITINSAKIISGSTRGSIRIWNLATGEMILSSPCHNDWITSLCSTPLLSFSMSCSLDGTISFLFFTGPKSKSTRITTTKPPGPQAELFCLKTNPENGSTTFILGGKNGFWNCSVSQMQFRKFPIQSCKFCALSQDEKFAAACSLEDPKVIKIFSMEENLLLQNVISSESFVRNLAFFQTETLLWVTTDRKLLKKVWLSNSKPTTITLLPSIPKLLHNDPHTCIVSMATQPISTYDCNDGTQSGDLVLLDFWQQQPTSYQECPKTEKKSCLCGFDWPYSDIDQTSIHLLLHCPLYEQERMRLFKTVASITRKSFAMQGTRMEELYSILIYGSEYLNIEESLKVQEAVQTFSQATNSFPRQM